MGIQEGNHSFVKSAIRLSPSLVTFVDTAEFTVGINPSSAKSVLILLLILVLLQGTTECTQERNHTPARYVVRLFPGPIVFGIMAECTLGKRIIVCRIQLWSMSKHP